VSGDEDFHFLIADPLTRTLFGQKPNIRIHHNLHQLFEFHFRFPTKLLRGFAGVSD
jgi:hypothetical protein